MEKRIITVAGIQTAPGYDIEKNISDAETLVLKAKEMGAEIICLPELFSTPYFPREIGEVISGYSTTVPGPVTERFSSLARDEEVVLIVPLCESGPCGYYYNSAVVIDADGSLFPSYHKIHIPQDPHFYEKGYFCPGEEYKIFKTRYADIAVLICYDQWFMEAARIVSLMGAEMILYPTALGYIGEEIPAEGDWKEAWTLVQRSHSIANSVPVVSVNRCSTEKELSFFGGSFICDAFGRIIDNAGASEDIIIGEIDLGYGPCIRDGWGFFRNRRQETYGPLMIKTDQSDFQRSDTPANLGYHMPAEWEPHSAVWMTWPGNNLTFPCLEEVKQAYIEIIRLLSRSELVNLLIPGEVSVNQISEILKNSGTDMEMVKLYPSSCSDVWIRDYGPTFLVNRGIHELSAVRWKFNAWGEKYEELISDGEVADEIVSSLGIIPFSPGIVMEGGSFDVNGRGCLLTTRSCLLNPNRNPSLNLWDIEEYLKNYLGVNHIIWLNTGIEGDDTDGHIDDIARFVNPGTIVCALEDDEDDDNYPILLENYNILRKEKDQNGESLEIIPLPMPSAISDLEYRYPASYLNFYIGNRVVLVPVFNDPNDDVVLNRLKNLFPDREVVGIDSRAMIMGFGTIHCATQQQPKV